MIPVLMFHALAAGPGALDFPPTTCTSALAQWNAAGWRTIPLSEAVRHLRAQAAFPPRTFVITFDDGYASVYRVGFPLLQKYNWTATVFIAPGEHSATGGAAPLPTLYEREMLRWNEVREMQAHGITFGAHTLTHPDLTRLDESQAEHEIHSSQSILADALGEPVPFFAYPFGRFNPRVRALAARYFEAACSDRLGLLETRSDPFAMERVEAFYLRADWAARGLTRPWFSAYLRARNVPRRLRRAFQKLFAW